MIFLQNLTSALVPLQLELRSSYFHWSLPKWVYPKLFQIAWLISEISLFVDLGKGTIKNPISFYY